MKMIDHILWILVSRLLISKTELHPAKTKGLLA